MPLGPVVVFGASNFPFAYSTAGGDTACAFGAGCPVIVKAHPAHLKTSTLMASAIFNAARKQNMPDGIFGHIHGASFETGAYLAKHPSVKAIGFTGSLVVEKHFSTGQINAKYQFLFLQKWVALILFFYCQIK